jgi:hypothetical protein
MRQNLNFQEINKASLQRGQWILNRILPSGRAVGSEWVSVNPKRRDTSPGSFKVNLCTGRWADFATGDSGGDLISLIAYLNEVSQLSAAKKLSEILGV